ncbi:cysteine dioxygenase family protein [Actinomycetospora straminea]|uniref:Cysteine dioxygenase family protein n=1 Tax=Actinomycetospora straminea TaxID=663607 RepID=A0ABP9EAE3_9PSEU|nr:cysteine dioxygenase family protein [Actinomycetospora straminea]MDD7931980.1 cysteine dioxygenase family protein [Actinomycetospora straminea]
MTTTITTSTIPALTALTTDLDAAVRDADPGTPRVDAVGAALAPYLGDPRLLTPEQCVGDPARYRQHLLHVADDGAFSLVALVWLPGQTTPIHDHLSWCVVGVHAGEEHEERYRRVGDLLVPDGEDVAAAGSVTGLLPPGDIHRVTNTAPTTTISLHVYGVDVRRHGSSIRRRYDLPIA